MYVCLSVCMSMSVGSLWIRAYGSGYRSCFQGVSMRGYRASRVFLGVGSHHAENRMHMGFLMRSRVSHSMMALHIAVENCG